MAVRVPDQVADLATALDSGADEIVITGRVSGPVTIDRPLTLRGEGEGAVLHAAEGRALVLSADVVVQDLGIVGDQGTGVYITAGRPTLTRVRVVSGNVAVVCRGDSAPVLREVVAERCAHGLLVEEDAAPDVDTLTLIASGGGMVFRDRARGVVRQCAVLSGSHAAIDISGDAEPLLEGIIVPQTAASAVFVHGRAAPVIRELISQQSRLASIELAGDSTATIVDAVLQKAGGSGLFVHDRARPVLRELTVEDCALAGVEVAEAAAPDAQGILLQRCAGSGLFLRGTAGGTWKAVRCEGTGKAGIEAGEQADPTVDGVVVVEPRGSGLYLHERSRGTWLSVRVQGSSLAGLEIAGHAAPELEGVEIFGSEQGGLWVHGDARAEVIGLSVQHALLAAVEVAEAGRLSLEEAVVDDTRGFGLRVIEDATLDGQAIDLRQGDTEIADRARVVWSGGAAARPIRVSGDASLVLTGVAADDVTALGEAVLERT
ncbi:MAG: hypothetical protein H6742_17355 [Alphaproteobacteria bacterium]|nr:hypothetical protein [Alphaproteobacteria bacterium]